MALRRHIIGWLLVGVAATAPHLHVEPPHECVHHASVEAAGDSYAAPAVEPALERCAQCRVQVARAPGSRATSATPDASLALRVRASGPEASVRSIAGAGLCGPRGPPSRSVT